MEQALADILSKVFNREYNEKWDNVSPPQTDIDVFDLVNKIHHWYMLIGVARRWAGKSERLFEDSYKYDFENNILYLVYFTELNNIGRYELSLVLKYRNGQWMPYVTCREINDYYINKCATSYALQQLQTQLDTYKTILEE